MISKRDSSAIKIQNICETTNFLLNFSYPELGVNFSKDSIESAYCFFHQKLRVYEFSHSHTQRDNIEYAISQYIERMNPLLY